MASQNDKQSKIKSVITINDCSVIVKKSLDSDAIEIIDYKFDEVKKQGLDHMYDYFRLIVKVKKENEDDANEIFFFIKSLPLENEIAKEFIEKFGFFRKEVQLYKNILCQMKNNSGDSKWYPECFLARDEVIVLEDLQSLGYNHIPQNEIIPDASLKAGFTALARMHSETFDLEQNVFSENENIYDKYKETFFEACISGDPWISAGMEFLQVLALKHPVYGEKYKEQIENDLPTIMNGVFERLEPSNKFKNVFCHRNLWVDSLIFKKNEADTSCVLLNFQVCRVCPPAYDFMLLLYFNVRRSIRDEKYEEYQEFYYSQLVKESNKLGIDKDLIPSHDEFVESCEFYKITPLVFNGLYIQRTKLPKNLLAELEVIDHEKHNNFCNIDRSEVVVDNMEKEENNKDYLFEIVGEIIEEFIIKKQNN